MASVKELARLMKKLEDQLVVCMRCGMCQAVCPVFAQTGREADVARGKLALLDGLLQEMFKDPQGVYERLNRCLLCGSCAANCPSGVSVMEIFLQARAILAGFMGLPPAKKAILRGMLAHPELFDHVMAWGAKFQKIFTREVNDVIGTSCARINSPLIGDRHFRGLAEKPFHRLLPELDTAPAKGRPRAAFFVGCLLDKFFPDIAQAVVEVLQAHAVGIFMPPGQACCGIPAVSAGDTQTFGKLVRHNLALFEAGRFDYLVTACATCTSTIRKVWPMMLREEAAALRARVEKMAAKTLDVNQFLVDEVGLLTRDRQKDGEPVAVTYHDPCHLKKSLGVAAQPRAVIAANPDYRLIEMPEADACCGMGGSFNLQYYELSAGIGRRKRDNIQASGAAIVATGCPACMLQISDALSRTGDRVAVRHPVQLYAESLRSKP